MGCKEHCSFSACGCLGIIISIIVGIVIGLLFNLGLISSIVTSVWITFGLAVLFLVLLFLGSFTAASKKSCSLAKCICDNGKCLLTGTIGTILASLIALSITLTVGSTFAAVLVGLIAFFTALMIISIVALIKCIIHELCN